ncbi:MAG: alpha/beta hydrolase, partial [Deltaproteobacteria bacterium]|nr:alpha/beta hydrolase [Deltaproteobacteria bacterium]
MNVPRPKEIEIQIPGLKLAGLHHPNPSGFPTLGLHGWLDNATTFDMLAPLLPGLDLVSLDLAGHGISEHRHPTA